MRHSLPQAALITQNAQLFVYVRVTLPLSNQHFAAEQHYFVGLCFVIITSTPPFYIKLFCSPFACASPSSAYPPTSYITTLYFPLVCASPSSPPTPTPYKETLYIPFPCDSAFSSRPQPPMIANLKFTLLLPCPLPSSPHPPTLYRKILYFPLSCLLSSSSRLPSTSV